MKASPASRGSNRDRDNCAMNEACRLRLESPTTKGVKFNPGIERGPSQSARQIGSAEWWRRRRRNECSGGGADRRDGERD
jgi:hypothetical protein